MKIHKIKEAFDPYFQESLENWEKFASLGKLIHCHKGEILKRPHDIEKHFNLILSGSGSIHLWNKNNYKCVDLAYEFDFFGDYMSYMTQQPSPLETIMIEDSELLQFSYHNFQNMLAESKRGEKITRIMADFAFISKQQQQIDLLTKTAFERLQQLKIQVPKLLERTPKKYISSYLGITPQSLSRIIKAFP
ncbi:Crp/Fnr family transcriptional regulator [Subsaximicrobium wynnwilliamsii]|uniref:Crp/Fnr family transcriptional regulator n=1 Tax=Subsaximicrobium wynnwilliamsii TaxID=291179 RepID=A0A5C6ZDQ6_9FLAO|nr:Crp/Fnr family transcriptional regulator [Subsaximicrobium wynnwilliamsii]TXD82392.1 Crp/Fnr family transcriptional regulator [Subsaximicrobium wynnwilliamsii]TXD88034.1 Crp/Fnr family transcriptional regulator [Subsaximicrobium wynnwilliamsii]TXE02104.1 Crp/Fnr family transcriptional regulator [Subsaximicrobium wynnwilliamsii]